eukprot:8721562-Alexandrium_andersonii.AAC.1
MHGSCHDAAEAGCSWRKRAPRSNCERYSWVMNSRCVLASDLLLTHTRMVNMDIETAPVSAWRTANQQ